MGDEDVGRLDVAVHPVRRVQYSESFEQLIEDVPQLLLVKRGRALL